MSDINNMVASESDLEEQFNDIIEDIVNTVRDPYSFMNGNYKTDVSYCGIKARIRDWSPNLRG